MENFLQIQLIPSLAAENPEVYKQTLIAQFCSDPRRKNFLAEMRIQGRFPGVYEKLDAFELNTLTWMSSSRPESAGLELGTLDMKDWDNQTNFRSEMFYLGEGYEYWDQVMHIFSHEMAHKIPSIIMYENKYAEIREMFDNLMSKLFQIRSNNVLGLTQIGTFEGKWGNRTPEMQVAEDFADLAAMYLMDKGRFDNYQEFMENPNFSKIREVNGLISLNTNVVEGIFNNIRTIVDKFTEPQVLGGSLKVKVLVD